MGYLLDLRKTIGHQAVLAACASVIIYDDHRGVLLQKRVDNGFWGFHGGSMEMGETAEVAASREAKEETGLYLKSLDLFTVAAGPEQHFFYPNGDEIHVVDHIFISNDFSGQLEMQEEEVSELRWFAYDEVPIEQLMPSTRTPLIAFLNQKLGK